MQTVLIVEHNNQVLESTTANALKAARELDDNPIVLVAGYQCRAVAEEAACLMGVHSVWLVDDPLFEHPLAEHISQLVVQLAASCKAILAPATTFGKNCLPRIAALLDVAQVSDVIAIQDANTFVHPIYAGNALETVRVLDDIKVLTIRTTAFKPEKGKQPPCPIETLPVSIEPAAVRFVGHETHVSTRPSLNSARIVVSGGRGLQSAEHFKLIEELADVCGAAVGASRAAVDAGFVSNDCQVGQTGHVVAPSLYIAVGISGAIQHIAGMKDAEVIVAINKDPDAPIFQIADYGLVGDLFELVPQLIAKLKEMSC